MTYNEELVVVGNLDLAKHVDRVQDDSRQPVDVPLYFWGTIAYELPLPRGATSEFAVQSFELIGNGA